MKQDKKTNSEAVIRQSDYYKIEIIVFLGFTLPFSIATIPLLLLVKPLFVYICYGGLLAFFIRDLIYYFKTKQADSILLILNNDGVNLDNQFFYSWDEIEYLKVRYVVVPPLDRFKIAFCVKPNNRKESRIQLSDNYYYLLPIFRRKVQRIVEGVGKPDLFIYDISFWKQFRVEKNIRYYRD